MSAADEKARGNEEFKAGNYDKAITHFSKAIALEPNHVLYSNRSACYCGLRKYPDALKDAERCIEMKGDWGKARAARPPSRPAVWPPDRLLRWPARPPGSLRPPDALRRAAALRSALPGQPCSPLCRGACAGLRAKGRGAPRDGQV